jgi:siroheme synthase
LEIIFKAEKREDDVQRLRLGDVAVFERHQPVTAAE